MFALFTTTNEIFQIEMCMNLIWPLDWAKVSLVKWKYVNQNIRFIYLFILQFHNIDKNSNIIIKKKQLITMPGHIDVTLSPLEAPAVSGE